MPALTTTAKPARELIVLRRYEIKQAYKDLRPGDVILVVRNGYGQEETVTLRRSKRHSCTCKHCVERQVCCLHIDHGVKLENARWKTEQTAKVAVVALVVEEVAVQTKTARRGMATRRVEDEAMATKIIVELAKVRQAKEAAKVSKSTEQAMMDAPLTKNNKAFSILR